MKLGAWYSGGQSSIFFSVKCCRFWGRQSLILLSMCTKYEARGIGSIKSGKRNLGWLEVMATPICLCKFISPIRFKETTNLSTHSWLGGCLILKLENWKRSCLLRTSNSLTEGPQQAVSFLQTLKIQRKLIIYLGLICLPKLPWISVETLGNSFDWIRTIRLSVDFPVDFNNILFSVHWVTGKH